jgi:hypothetical protein
MIDKIRSGIENKEEKRDREREKRIARDHGRVENENEKQTVKGITIRSREE